MSLPRYPAYKDSGVEWLGEVPEHWDVIEARREIAFLTSGSRGWAEYYSDEGPIFLRIGNLTRDCIHIDLQDIQRVSPPPGVEGDRTQVSAGDVLFSITAYLGSVAVVPQGLERAYVSQHVCLARLLGRRLLPEWLAYSVLSSTGKAYLESESYGGTKVQLSLDDIKSFPLPLPSLEEQRALTKLLDHETAKIDALIAEQQRLIELLQEKRQAVISHAVTKGLNPNAPMKDSGVEWLGEVPEHWEIKALKHITNQVSVGVVVEPSKYYDDEGSVPALRSLNIKDGRVAMADCVYISTDSNEQLSKSRLSAGDIVIVRTGQPGTCAVIPEELDGCNCIDLIFIRRPSTGSSFFLKQYLSSDAARFQYAAGSEGAIQQHFNVKTAAGLIIPWPPEKEQREIADWLQEETSELGRLTADASKSVELLQERRSALISAAVCGQIDIRGLVPEAVAQ